MGFVICCFYRFHNLIAVLVCFAILIHLGIDTVRDKIKEFASSRQLFQSGTKLIILDEADSMTRTAQFALRRVIEKYTRTTRFCIIANYVNKIIPALQSRCTCFRFGPLDAADISKHLVKIASLVRDTC